MMNLRTNLAVALLMIQSLLTVGCAKTEIKTSSTTTQTTQLCAKTLTSTGAGSSGTTSVFLPDPIIGSGNKNLSPTSTTLDTYRSTASLQNLGGQGVLAGTFVSVGNGVTCNGNYNAFSSTNNFTYSHSDAEFQEAMAYYWGDGVRSFLNSAGYLQPTSSLSIVAHCMEEDNAYYSRSSDQFGNITQSVCLGDSVQTPGASYADDGQVTVHEVEHGATVNHYSGTQSLNQFWYDEAGSMNEGISDFMALLYTDVNSPVSNAMDPRLFSRWALGSFLSSNSERGSNKCPQYDPTYPDCTNYSSTSSGFSAANNRLSYSFPDGIGWPFANNFNGPGYLKNAYLNYGYQEEIHNNGTIITGALWDIYQALKGTGYTSSVAATLTTKVLLEGVKHLPKPTSSVRSPVTFVGLAAQINTAATSLGYSSGDKTLISNALTARGLVGYTALGANWADIGTGSGSTAGLRVKDDPSLLKSWLSSMGASQSVVTQGSITANSLADPGEVVALWFDIKNTSATTAGGVLVTATSGDSDLTFLDGDTNIGAISSASAQVMYGKINGTAIVTAYTDSSSTYNVLTSSTDQNRYFKTNPYYASNYTTALWAKISSSAAHGKTINISVNVAPENGPSQTLIFPITLH